MDKCDIIGISLLTILVASACFFIGVECQKSWSVGHLENGGKIISAEYGHYFLERMAFVEKLPNGLYRLTH